MPLRKALRTASDLGARAVQIDARHEIKPHELSNTGRRQLRKLMDDLNLQVSSVSFPTRRGYDEPQDLDQRVAATQAAMKFAFELGARVVVNRIGRVPADPQSPQWQSLVEVLRNLSDYGQHAGAVLAARTGSESGSELERLLNALPDGTIGADLDPASLCIHGYSTLEAIEALGPKILHVHANDAVYEPDQARGTEVQLGRGNVDFPALLAALEASDYQGWITVSRHHAHDPVTEIGQAVEYLNNL
jgi:sugar phosphate isomerase/epimerase